MKNEMAMPLGETRLSSAGVEEDKRDISRLAAVRYDGPQPRWNGRAYDETGGRGCEASGSVNAIGIG